MGKTARWLAVDAVSRDANQQVPRQCDLAMDRAYRIDLPGRQPVADIRSVFGDGNDVAKMVDAVNVATAHLVKARVDQIIALRKTLTPTQWTELKARWAEEEEDEEEDDD